MFCVRSTSTCTLVDTDVKHFMRPYLCPICWSLRGEQIFYCKGEERSKKNLSERDAIIFFCQRLLKQSCRKWMNFCPIFVHCSCQGLRWETNFKHPTISIRRVTLITEFDTLWLSPGIIETAGSKLINGTLVDRGGSELQY